MADEELEVTFTLENDPLNAEYELTPNEEINADFLINAQGTTWGSISGTLSNQTDLQAALDLKADKTEVESVTGALSDSITAVSDNLQSEAATRADNDVILQNNINTVSNNLTDEIDNRISANTILQGNINSLDDKVDSLTGALDNRIDTLSDTVTANYNTLDDKIDSVNGALSDSISAVDDKYNSITGALSDSITAIDNTINNYGDIVNYDAADFATSIQGALANTALQPNDNISLLNNDARYITSADLPTVNNSTITIQKNGTTVESFNLNQATNETVNISVPTTAADVNALPDTTTINDLTTSTQQAALNSGANTTNIGQIATNASAISTEVTDRQNADIALQNQIDAIVSSSDVFDIVGTYAELQAYDIATVPVNDIIKVLVDSTHNDAATYYRCVESGGVKSWSYIGSEGAYYTKGEADAAFVPQTRTVNGKALSNNITLNASDVGALPDSTVIPTVNNSTITIQKNGAAVDTFTLNQATAKTINITVPTDTNDLTNDAGYITAASLPTDYYTKSEIDAIIPQPTKVPIVYYQPTDSYCYTESNNRFYGSHVFEKLYLVQPKTSGTTQVIDMSTTFSLSFTIDYQKAPSASITLAEIMTSYSAGKGVLLQLNTTGLYYRNNITGTTITGTRALTAGNSYDIKADYDGTHMIISYKLSSDANYTQINSTTCTCDGANYNYAAIGMNADNGNMSLSSVVLTNGADTLYSYTAGKIALDYDGNTLKLNASNQLSVDFTGYATETWVGNQGYLTSGDLTNYVTTNTAQTISAKKTFTGEKAILFKQTSASDKLGFTLYNSSNTELGAFEYRPNTISGAAFLNVNTSYANSCYVGFRYWGTAVNVIAPKPSTAGDYYIPVNITDGNTTVTAANTGLVNISSLLPDISGKQNTLTAGSNITISGDTISSTDTTYSDFTGADSVTAGASGLVPAPSAGDEDKILSGGGTWNALKTVNNTSILGSGNIDTKEVFVVYYNQTTYQDVASVVAYGKVTYCIDSTEEGTFDGIKVQYVCAVGANADIVFTGTYNNKLYTYTINSSDVWTKTVTDVANQDLSNLSATGEAKFDAKVNKSGDTMTGALWNEEAFAVQKLSPNNITKGTTPSNTMYLGGIRWIEEGTSDIGATHRFANIECAVDSNGDTRLILQALKNEANSSDAGSINIKYPKTGNPSCTFPNTTCVDGQWINKSVDLKVNQALPTATTSFTIPSINFPDSTYIYECLFTGQMSGVSGKNGTLMIGSSEVTGQVWICGVSGAGRALGSVIIPIGVNRSVTLFGVSGQGGTYILSLRAIRRVGANS